MVCATAKNLVILGVTSRNLQLLMEGKPIRISHETHGLKELGDLTIIIVYGVHENSLLEDMKSLITRD